MSTSKVWSTSRLGLHSACLAAILCGAAIAQTQPPKGVPSGINECEGIPCVIPGTWTWSNGGFTAWWPSNQAQAIITIQSFVPSSVVLNRTDIPGSAGYGYTAVYTGTFSVDASGLATLTGTETWPAGNGYAGATHPFSATWQVAPPTCDKPDVSYNVPDLYQNDLNWGSTCYDGFSGDCANTVAPPPNKTGKHETIGDWGCNLTALTALLSYSRVPFPADPYAVNAYMQAHHGYEGRDVDVSTTVRSLSSLKGGNLQYVPLNGKGQKTPSTPTDIASALDNGPILAAVSSRGMAQGHFIVITGRTCKTDGTYEFSTMNPGDPKPSGMLTRTAIVRGYLKDPLNRSAIDISASDSIEVLLTDPLGRRIGFDPTTKDTLGNIPSAFYNRDYVADPDTDEPMSGVTKFLTVNQPISGFYLLRVTVVNKAPYALTVHTYSTDGTDQGYHKFTGNAALGSSVTYTVTFSSVNSPATTITEAAGDVNGDGIADCSDVAIIKAALGKRRGQAGFDPKADVNRDDVVDVRDLAAVSRQLP